MKNFLINKASSQLQDAEYIASDKTNQSTEICEYSINENDDKNITQTKNEQTNLEAGLNILNNTLGTALLSSPDVDKTGIILSIFLIILSMILNRRTILHIISSCNKFKKNISYIKFAELTFGKYGRLIICYLYIFQVFLILVSYLTAFLDNFERLFIISFSREQQLLIILAFVSPLTFIRKLSNVAKASAIKFLLWIFVIIILIIDCIIVLYKNGLKQNNIKQFPSSFKSLNKGIPIFVFVFAIQPGASVVLSSLKNTSIKNIKKISLQQMSITTIIFLIFQIICYLTFTNLTESDIIDSINDDIQLKMTAFSLIFILILSYMFMFVPIRFAVINLLFNKNETLFEASKLEFYGVTIMINILVVCVAFCVKSLGSIMDIAGAIASLLGFILPIILQFKSKNILLEKFNKENLLDIIIVILGFYILVTGLLYAAIE